MLNRLLLYWKMSQRRCRTKRSLIVESAKAGLQKLSDFYGKAFPVMAATYIYTRFKLEYFVYQGWNCGAETCDEFQATDEHLIETRIKSA